MKIVVFTNSLGLGGTEKAACFWAGLLKERGQQVRAVSLEDGPRRADLQRHDIPLSVLPHPGDAKSLTSLLEGADIIHAHAPGFPHQGDLLGKALCLLPRKIPIVQTNIFGQLRNPAENHWTDFRLFISWTSCVQAARRSGRQLNLEFFRHQSVASYPVEDPLANAAMKTVLRNSAAELRAQLGLTQENILLGRFSRPEPNKWTPLVLDAFLAACRYKPNLRLLLREPPPVVAQELISSGLATWFPSPNEELGTKNQEPTKSSVILMSATPDPDELKISQMACDVVLHASSIGESFGYGIAEPMALGKPVITNSVPWHDQAQIELVRHAECGLIASTVPSMKSAILRMAESNEWRVKCGESARKHILSVADPGESTDRVEMAMRCAIEDRDNPLAEQHLEKAIKTAEYLDKHQWGHSREESFWLRGTDAKIRFLRWQRLARNRVRNSWISSQKQTLSLL
jgi:glycosyltransferase involved in cell wall biosynthesis